MKEPTTTKDRFPQATVITKNAVRITLDDCEVLQCYDYTVAVKYDSGRILVDAEYWDNNALTIQRLARFLGVTVRDLKNNIAVGRYEMAYIRAYHNDFWRR